MRDTATSPGSIAQAGGLARLEAWMPVLVLLIAGGALPLLGDSYIGVIGTRACIYWVLVSGLNLVVGFAGQIAIGWVALLTLGAYVTAVLTAGTAVPAGMSVFRSPEKMSFNASVVTPLAIIGVASSTTKGLPTCSGAMRHSAVSTCSLMGLLPITPWSLSIFKISGTAGRARDPKMLKATSAFHRTRMSESFKAIANAGTTTLGSPPMSMTAETA